MTGTEQTLPPVSLSAQDGASIAAGAGSGDYVGTRIIVVGTTCSGKSTLAEQIAARRGLTCVDLDALYWEPHWTPAAPEVFRQRVSLAVAPDGWVLAGNYSAQQDVSWPRAQTIVWLDMPLALVLQRIVSRSWRRSRSGELLWGTNRERFWPQFRLWSTDDSLLSFAAQTHRMRRRRYEQAMQDPRWAHLRWVRLRSRAAVAAWLRELPSA